MLDIVASEETLRNVIRSVTRNWQSIILTGLLALILVYLFSIVGYMFFQKDFRLEVEKLDNGVEYNLMSTAQTMDWPQCEKDDRDCQEAQQQSNEMKAASDDDEGSDDKVATCNTLRMCILTTLNWGLRNGGGIGDVLRNVDPGIFHPFYHLEITYY